MGQGREKQMKLKNDIEEKKKKNGVWRWYAEDEERRINGEERKVKGGRIRPMWGMKKERRRMEDRDNTKRGKKDE